MTELVIRRLTIAGFSIAFSVVGLSCGTPNHLPPAELARASLESALSAWRDGKKPDAVAEANPPIQVIDSEWTNGRKLTSFEVLREEPSELDKRFVTKLTNTAPAGIGEVVYIVVGTQPVRIFREEDYNRSMNMDNNPTVKKKR